MRLGIDFGGTNLKYGVFDDDGSELLFKEIAVNELDKNNLLKSICKRIFSSIHNVKIESGGFASRGLVNSQTGYIEGDVGIANLFNGINVKEYLSKYFSIPFVIDNDARAYAWGEYKFGIRESSKAMVAVTLGTGVGCSLVYNGEPFRGGDTLGGLLGGHISIDSKGERCACGNNGCLELYCSATALSKRISSFDEFKNTQDPLPDFFRKVNSNKEYTQLLDEFIHNLSIGLTNIIHAYGPDIIVLGGGLMNSHEVILPLLRKQVREKAWTVPKGRVELKVSKLGNKAAVMGIAFMQKQIKY